MNVEFYGTVLDTVQYKQNIYIITQNKDKYYLISNHKSFDITNVLASGDNLEYLHLILRQELAKISE